ncbi:MAG: AmmeMemoRadiSam system protein B [Candidatus Kapabacteria bacterium]|nr:AmmeMemoRadiSam system protein B [Ignavibacteriota bacterium]MCW5884534.1 AmmeMemoRadiSam system protein B [Candidatus Kapabacteria bacterium]
MMKRAAEMPEELIPTLRNNLQLLLMEEDGQRFVLMNDNHGYAEDEIAVSIEFYNLLISLGGKTKYSDLGEKLKINDLMILNQILQNIKDLDEMGFLNSSSFKIKKSQIDQGYFELVDRPYVCAQNSYPEDVGELNNFLAQIFNSTNSESSKSNSSAIIVPHIDLKLSDICSKIYSSGYHSARETDFDLLVVLGTAHYDSSDLLMPTKKNYKTPLGTAKTDTDILELWESHLGDKLPYNDLAHKPEHSIEYQILLSQYYFINRNFTVLPILVGSFGEFVYYNSVPESSEDFRKLISSLKLAIEESGRKALFIASVDFAHIGRKFGDDYDAEPILDSLKNEDKILIDALTNLDKHRFFRKISEDNDKYRICGTSPIYSLMSLKDFKRCEFLDYAQWNETQTKSAVSFASLALFDD